MKNLTVENDKKSKQTSLLSKWIYDWRISSDSDKDVTVIYDFIGLLTRDIVHNLRRIMGKELNEPVIPNVALTLHILP